MKKKIFKFIKRKWYQICTCIFNNFNIKNKLHAKGCKVSIGRTFISGLKINNHGTNNEVFIGNFINIRNCTINIYGNNNKIVIKDYSKLNQVEFYMENSNNEIFIGQNTKICGKTHLATIEGTKIRIGNNCLFSSNIHFSTGDSHSILDLNGKRINPSQDILISDHVWIGTKVTCLKGVYVAKDSIIGATTTLCNRYEEPNSVIAGVPGKIIKKEINWDIELLPLD